jgi:hypothetical protein
MPHLARVVLLVAPLLLACSCHQTAAIGDVRLARGDLWCQATGSFDPQTTLKLTPSD